MGEKTKEEKIEKRAIVENLWNILSSEKAAYKAAKSAGKGKPLKHAHPKKGKSHPNKNRNEHEGLEENIQKDGTHFIYP